MKPTELTAAKGSTFTPDDGSLFNLTATFSDSLETEFKGVTQYTRTVEGAYWLTQEDGTWTEIPAGFHYVQVVQVIKE